MTIKEKLKLLADVKKANDRRTKEWAARQKGQTNEKK